MRRVGPGVGVSFKWDSYSTPLPRTPPDPGLTSNLRQCAAVQLPRILELLHALRTLRMAAYGPAQRASRAGLSTMG